MGVHMGPGRGGDKANGDRILRKLVQIAFKSPDLQISLI